MLNEILGVAARFNQHLTRKFGVTGGAPSPQLTPEIAPVFTLEGGAEGHILQSEYLAGASLNVAPVAAKKSAAGVFNPVGSNIVVVVTHIDISCLATLNVAAGVLKASPYPITPTAAWTSYHDTRVLPDPAGSSATKIPAAVARADNDPPALPGANLFFRVGLANTFVSWDGDVVLAPGWGLAAYVTTVNTGAFFSFNWREVPLAHGEVGPF